MDIETQNKNFERLLDLAINQKLTRDGFIEGNINNLEKDIETCCDLGLITYSQYESIMFVFSFKRIY